MWKGTITSLTLIMVLTVATVCFAGVSNLQYTDGVLLVRFKNDVQFNTADDGTITVGDNEVDRLLARFHAKKVEDFFGGYIPKDEEYRHKTRNDYKIIFPFGTDMELVSEEFNRLPSIEYASPDIIHQLNFIPNDPSFVTQYWLEIIDAESAWDIVTGSDEIIVVGLDSGVDWNHPDLVDNIWINPGEDIDGDPRPFEDDFPDFPGTLGDWNNVDDDGNGLVDDFIGWDWVAGVGSPAPGEDAHVPDNDPIDFHGHGTGVVSAMAGVTNNGIGGAGVAFDCQIMALRCGFADNEGEGRIQTSSAISGLNYARDMGATIVNMSYGGPSPSQFMENAVESAWNNGMLLFGASGNDNVGTRQYPGDYDNVITVGATDSNDERANFSNYGDWVEIAAPGVGCYTAWFDDGYTSWDGTSVATPIAAGIGALVAQMYPNATNTDWRQIVIEAVDPITPDQPQGSGRVNAYKAVTQWYWPEMTIDEWQMSNPDGNGHPNIDEEIEVTLVVSNAEGWRDASDVQATVELSVDGIQYAQQVVDMGDIPNGTSGDNLETPLRFTATDPALNGHFAMISITVSCGPNEYEIGLSERIMIGTPDILLVDDDGGEDYDTYIQDNLDEYFYNYFHHDITELDGAPSADEISQYSTVIWMTGDVELPLHVTEQSVLQAAMDNNVNVFLFGQTLDEQLAGTDFYANYLHCESIANNFEISLTAVPGAGGPVVEDGQFLLAGNGGAANNTDPDAINPLGGAVAAYNYLGSGNTGGIYYEDDNRRHVYFPFAFEAISGLNQTTSRTEALSAILSWFEVLPVKENEPVVVPSSFTIESIYPNPFNSTTAINFTLPTHSRVEASVYDLLGREVATIHKSVMSAGNHKISWNATDLSAGVYFVVLESGRETLVDKVVLLK